MRRREHKEVDLIEPEERCGGSIVLLNGGFNADDSSSITIIGGVMREELGGEKVNHEGEIERDRLGLRWRLSVFLKHSKGLRGVG